MVKTALIIADDTNGLQCVYGIPAVRRLVLLARQFAFDRIHVISRHARLQPVVSDLIGIDAFHHFVDESQFYRAVEELGFDEEEFVLVLMARHVIDRSSLDRLLQAQQGQEISLLEEDGKKSARTIFFVKAPCLLPLLASLRSLRGSRAEIEARAVHIKASPGLPELVDGGREKVQATEAALMASVRKATEERDSFLSRHVSRPISRLISPGAARAGMTANMVTLCNTLIGLGAAFLLFLGGYLPQVAGSLLFLFSVILDGVDGEVARLRLNESSFGHYLDVICDNVVHIAVFSGLARGLYHDTSSPVFLYLLGFLLGGFALCALVINWILAEHRAGPRQSGTTDLLEALFNNRDFAYVVAGFAVIHRLDWFLVAAAFGTYLFAGTLWVTKLRSSSAKRTLQSE